MGFFARLSVLVSACFPLSLVMQAAAWCSVGTVVSSCNFLLSSIFYCFSFDSESDLQAYATFFAIQCFLQQGKTIFWELSKQRKFLDKITST